MIFTIIQVAVGGAIGACARYLIGQLVSFPMGTLTVNVLGSFLLGIAFVLLAEKGMERWMPLIMTGVLGGFTTFSTFSLDVFKLYEADRMGAAGGYILSSLVLSLVALFIAVSLMRGFQG